MALGLPGLLSHSRDDRHEDADENGDDGDYHQQLDECEAAASAASTMVLAASDDAADIIYT